MRVPWRPPIIVAALLALGACGGGGGDDDANDDDGLGPLAELMGWMPQEPAEARRQQLEVEEQVADCMRAEGWEYEPVDWSAQMPDVDEEDITLAMTDPTAYGEKYGYGVVYNYETNEATALENGDDPRMGVGEEFEDPNADYVGSLSEDERTEYYASLYGEQSFDEVDEDEDGVLQMPSLDEQGCQGQAQLSVYGEQPYDNPDIQQRMTDYYESLQDDPQLLATFADWADCMGEDLDGLEAGGEPVERPDQMWTVFEERKMTAMGLEPEPVESTDEWTEDTYTMTGGDAEGNGGYAWKGTPEAIDDADLEALRADELEAWKTDAECQDETGVRDRQRAIEEQFADELKAEFPELSDARTGES